MEKLFLAEPTGEVEAERLLPGLQVELWSKRFISNNRGANAHSLERDGGRMAVLNEHLHLVLEFGCVIQVCSESQRQFLIRGDHSFTGFNPPAGAFASL